MAGKDNLTPFTSDNAKEMQRKGAAKRKENHAKKVLMSQIYAEFLEREYDVKLGDKKTKMTGAEFCNEAIKAIINRKDSSSVSMLKEIRESTEGSKIQLSGNVTTKLESAEERLKAFEELMK